MYELVLIQRGKEEVIFRSDDMLEVLLKKESHVRSLTSAVLEVRKITETAPQEDVSEPVPA
ncbi:MAG: hypothetical protein ACOC24_04970 [Desulfovibrionales bacterium]